MYVCFLLEKKPEEKKIDNEIGTEENKGHIMISYQWTHQTTIIKVTHDVILDELTF